ncbi:MAG: hypothetical protein KBG15_12240 [Kofleriaceae bacterium]|nr:hypothetical protein [Kofleriaceae bacterium]
MMVILDGNAMQCTPADAIAEGGEALVFDLHDGRVLKLWKQPHHADFAHDPVLQAQAGQRIAHYSAKLLALPATLASNAPQLIVPTSLCRDQASNAIVGFAMRRVDGTLLHSLSEPRSWHKAGFDGGQRVAILRSLHQAVCTAHRAGFIIGDFNDLNVVVDGSTAQLIDVDSFGFGAWPATMFSERFVDPRLLTRSAAGVAMVGQHDVTSDWFAFCVMVVRVLLGTSPWGGVWAPTDPAARCTPSERLLRRISIFTAGVVYPRAAQPIATLPDAVAAQLRAVFAGTIAATFPVALLDMLRYATCPVCGQIHARAMCSCGAAAPFPPASVCTSTIQATPIAPASITTLVERVTATPSRHGRVWLRDQAIWRQRGVREERIATLLANQSLVWANHAQGFGIYRAGGFTVGLLFRTNAGLAREITGLPPLRGQLVEAHAAISDTWAWLTVVTAEQGVIRTQLIVMSERDGVLAQHDVSTELWAVGLAGSTAMQHQLYVPTDDGVVRLGLQGKQLVREREFPQTAAFVNAASRLTFDQRGLITISEQGAFALSLR